MPLQLIVFATLYPETYTLYNPLIIAELAAINEIRSLLLLAIIAKRRYKDRTIINKQPYFLFVGSSVPTFLKHSLTLAVSDLNFHQPSCHETMFNTVKEAELFMESDLANLSKYDYYVVLLDIEPSKIETNIDSLIILGFDGSLPTQIELGAELNGIQSTLFDTRSMASSRSLGNYITPRDYSIEREHRIHNHYFKLKVSY